MSYSRTVSGKEVLSWTEYKRRWKEVMYHVSEVELSTREVFSF